MTMQYVMRDGVPVRSLVPQPGTVFEAGPIKPLTFRQTAITSDGLPPLEVKRQTVAASREEVLLPLSDKERMLVAAIAEALLTLSPSENPIAGLPGLWRAVLPTDEVVTAAREACASDLERASAKAPNPRVAAIPLLSAYRGATGLQFDESVWR